MKRKKRKIKLGILGETKFKVILIICLLIIVGALVVKGIMSYKDKKAAEEAANDFSLHAYSVEQLEGGKYYIKDGDLYYPLPQGKLISTAEKDTAIPIEANPNTRMTMFGKDEERIPTMYKDCQLIYKASTTGEPTPVSFSFERFKDEGWSVGIRGLSNETDGGRYKTKIDNTSLYKGSTLETLNCNIGDEVIVDKINGIELTSENVSSGGTIKGLTYGETYTVDAYCGTTYVGMSAIADTHMLTSYELYTLTDYSMDPNNYLVVTVPSYMWSGYYYINGVGCFKYINNFKSQGNSGIDYNTPYFLGLDENGVMITSPAPENGETVIKENTSEEVNMEEFVWHYDLSIDNQQKQFETHIKYSPLMTMVDGKIVTEKNGAAIYGIGSPEAILTAPDGKKYDFVSPEDEIKEESEDATDKKTPSTITTDDFKMLSVKIEDPVPGTWKIDIKGMYSRTFDVSTSYSGSTSNMVVKDGDEPTVMTIYIPERLENGQITFNWDNTDHAGNFEFENENNSDFKLGSESTPEKISEQTYGKTVFDTGLIEAGEYKVTITGESLGHVYFEYGNIEEETTEEETSEAEG